MFILVVVRAQVRGYMDHLSRMDLTVEQLSRTGIGKTVRRFSRWPAQREGAVKSAQESASDLAKCAPSQCSAPAVKSTV